MFVKKFSLTSRHNNVRTGRYAGYSYIFPGRTTGLARKVTARILNCVVFCHDLFFANFTNHCEQLWLEVSSHARSRAHLSAWCWQNAPPPFESGEPAFLQVLRPFRIGVGHVEIGICCCQDWSFKLQWIFSEFRFSQFEHVHIKSSCYTDVPSSLQQTSLQSVKHTEKIHQTLSLSRPRTSSRTLLSRCPLTDFLVVLDEGPLPHSPSPWWRGVRVESFCQKTRICVTNSKLAEASVVVFCVSRILVPRYVRGSYNKYVDLSCLRLCSIVYIIASELRQMVSKIQWTKVDPRHGKSTYLL